MGWGDELMVTGQVRVMQERDPRRVKIVYEKGRWHEAWLYNPRIAEPREKGDFQELHPRTDYLRPYMQAKLPDRWVWKPYSPPRGELYFDEFETEFGKRHAGRIILEPHIKAGASPNKQWGWVRWNKLSFLLQEAGYRVTQVGGTVNALMEGAEMLSTKTMRLAASVLANARLAVLPEGGLHHVAAAVGCPAVVIFGGYIAPQVTGYPEQVSLFTGEGLGCGMRLPCKQCVQEMAAITPEAVFDKCVEVLGAEHRRRVAS